jgi:hypothetical protein
MQSAQFLAKHNGNTVPYVDAGNPSFAFSRSAKDAADAETAVRFLGRYSRLANRWMEQYGFSIGISDCLLSRRGLEGSFGLAAAEVEWRLHDAAENAAAEADPVVRDRNVQNELNRTPSAGSKARSWVSWFCKKETASLPLTSITPKWGNSQAPWKFAGGKVRCGLISVMA